MYTVIWLCEHYFKQIISHIISVDSVVWDQKVVYLLRVYNLMCR